MMWRTRPESAPELLSLGKIFSDMRRRILALELEVRELRKLSDGSDVRP
jgi:hypothetical protein